MNSDTTSGDYDFPARYYSIQGRWPSPDPSGLAAVDPTNPQSWDRYAYVLNNPLALTDPFGLCGGQGPDPDLPCPDVTSVTVSAWEGGWNAWFWFFTMQQTTAATVPDQLTPPPPPPTSGNSSWAWTFTLGVRAPNQTFKQCMVQHAQDYSIVGAVDLAAQAAGINSNLGSTAGGELLGGNHLNSLLFGEGVSTVAAKETPELLAAGMGTTLTYGRRTADLISLNLAGNGGRLNALGGRFPAGAGLKVGLEHLGRALNLGMSAAYRWGVDFALTGAEGVGCSIPQ